MFWSAKFSLLRAEGFSRSLNVLYGGLGISTTVINCNFCSNINFSKFLVITTLDPKTDPLDPNAGSGSALKPMRSRNNKPNFLSYRTVPDRKFLPKNKRIFVRLSVRQDNLVELLHYLDCGDSHINDVVRNKIFTPNIENERILKNVRHSEVPRFSWKCRWLNISQSLIRYGTYMSSLSIYFKNVKTQIIQSVKCPPCTFVHQTQCRLVVRFGEPVLIYK